MKTETFKVVDAKTGKKVGTIPVLSAQSSADITTLNQMLDAGKIQAPRDPRATLNEGGR
jgi:hypothetical protein